MPQQDILDQFMLGKALNFAKQHNFKGLLGFLTIFIFLPSLIWAYQFSSYLNIEQFETEEFSSEECMNLVGWSESAQSLYGLFTFLTLLLAIWGYLVLGWEQSTKKDDFTTEQFIDEINKRPLLASTEPYFQTIIKIYPPVFYFLMIIIFFGIAWNHGEVDNYACEPLRSFLIVYIVLHTMFYGFILLTLCCGLLGTGAYMHKHGFDDIMHIPQLYDEESEQQPLTISRRERGTSELRMSNIYYSRHESQEQNNENQ